MKLINGDCLEELKKIPDNSIDSIITDPPYGINFKSGRRKEKYKTMDGDDKLDWLTPFVEHCCRISRENTAHYIFCSFHNIEKFKIEFKKRFKIKNLLVWEKSNASMGDLTGDFAPKTELILFIQKGRRKINGKRDPNIFKFSRTGNKLHPTQKPVKLIEYLINKFTDKGDTIIDPFMGSGTTGVACVNTGRDFIGIELDKEYFGIAKRRIYEISKQS